MRRSILLFLVFTGCAAPGLFNSIRPGIHRIEAQKFVTTPTELDTSLVRVRTERYQDLAMWGRSWSLDLLFDKRTDSLFALEWSTPLTNPDAVRSEAIIALGEPADTTDGLLWNNGREAIALITLDSVILIRRGYSN